MAINRWDPFGTMLSMRDMMDRMMRDPFSALTPSSGMMAPPMEVTEDANQYQVRLSVPGVKPEDVNIQVEQNVLTVNGELRQPPNQSGQRTLHQERSYGTFMRSIALPGSIDAAKAAANFEHGVLTITLPKHEAARPRSIPIQTGATASGHMIEGQSSGQQATSNVQGSTGPSAQAMSQDQGQGADQQGEKEATEIPVKSATAPGS